MEQRCHQKSRQELSIEWSRTGPMHGPMHAQNHASLAHAANPNSMQKMQHNNPCCSTEELIELRLFKHMQLIRDGLGLQLNLHPPQPAINISPFSSNGLPSVSSPRRSRARALLSIIDGGPSPSVAAGAPCAAQTAQSVKAATAESDIF
jgi:hypothetical protein